VAAVIDLVSLPLVEAANFTPAHRAKVDLVVLHSMENPEQKGAARRVAQWFAGSGAPQASAHYLIDSTEIIRGVRDEDVAWAAPGANSNGIHLEHAGQASQSLSAWLDPYGRAMLSRSVSLCAALCVRWDIPPVALPAPALVARERGITTHAEVSRAFKRSSHWDPGPGFPLVEYVWRVSRALQGIEEAWA